jgi:SAM-dependent methyltransferase
MSAGPLYAIARRVVRDAGAIGLYDAFRFRLDKRRHKEANRRFLARHPTCAVPPLDLMFDAYNHGNYSLYIEGGEREARAIHELVLPLLSRGLLRIVEWGCGPARVTRHLSDLVPGWRLVGFDYNFTSVRWAAKHFPQFSFVPNGLEPPLPLASGSIDFLYAISVFTHLSAQAHERWTNEIFRVLKPGGIFLGTFQGRTYAERLSGNQYELFEKGELVVVSKGAAEGKKNYHSYEPEPYLRRLFSHFEWLYSAPALNDGLPQSVLIARRPPS